MEQDFKRDWGMEVTWASQDNHSGKILVFGNSGSQLPFHFHAETDKTWFVNSGKFMVRWIDTKDGKVYQQELIEGTTFYVERLKPSSLIAIDANSTMLQTSNQDTVNDTFNIIPATNIEATT
jgi:mannose-6-phosphate isomerase-like protein (cupin superfamily)